MQRGIQEVLCNTLEHVNIQEYMEKSHSVNFACWLTLSEGHLRGKKKQGMSPNSMQTSHSIFLLVWKYFILTKHKRLNQWLRGCFECVNLCVNETQKALKSWKECITPFSIWFFHFDRLCVKKKKKKKDKNEEKMHPVRVYMQLERHRERSQSFSCTVV